MKGIAVLAGMVLIGIVAFDIWFQNNHKSLVQTLVVPSEMTQFVLLTDISGFGDRAWYVYRMPIGGDLTKEMKSGHDGQAALFWNYSEAGDHYDNPKIEILKDRYLVFSRGSLYHSLYDLQKKTVLVNDENPWNSFQQSSQFKKYGEKPPSETSGTAMDVWVHENTHRKIEGIVNGAE